MVDGISTSVYGLGLMVLIALDSMPKAFPPIDAIVGNDSYVQSPSVELATTPEAWNSAWQRHKGITPIGNGATGNFPTAEVAPSVDFKQNEVLIVFGGLAAAGGYEVVDSTLLKKKVTVRLKPTSLSLNGRPTSINFRANPYAFYVFPKTQYPMIVQLPVTDQNGNTAWQTVGKVGGGSAQPASGNGQTQSSGG